MSTLLLTIAQTGTLKPTPNLFEVWMIGVLVLVLIILAWIRVSSPESFSQLGKGLFNVRLLRQLIREEGTIASLVSRLLSWCFFLILGLTAYMGITVSGVSAFGLFGVSLYAVLVGGLLTIYLLKIAGLLIFRFLVGGDYGLNEMIFNLVAHNNIVGLLVFPIVIIAAVVPTELYNETTGVTQSIAPALLLGLATIVIIVAYVSRLIRGLINSVQQRLPSIYIILYLCTLEFLPLALLVKALKS
jgi:hypothetical protein